MSESLSAVRCAPLTCLSSLELASMLPRRLPPPPLGVGPWGGAIYMRAHASHILQRHRHARRRKAKNQQTTCSKESIRRPTAMSVAGAVTIAAACAVAVPSRAPMSSASDDEARCGATAAAGAGGSPLEPKPPHECAVCLSELPAGDEAAVPVRRRTLPACGHAFHADCIGRWLPLRPECPLCRRPVLLAGGGGQRAAAGAPAAWARPAATIACGFGDGRVVWSRSPVPPPDSD
jgi:hypothetical protein